MSDATVPPAAETAARRPAVLAAIIGLGGIPLIAWFAHWYEAVLSGNCGVSQVIVNALAPGVLFLFLILALVANPLLRRTARSFALRPRDLFLVLALWMFAGAAGYVHLVTPALSAAGNLNGPACGSPNLVKSGVKEQLPARLFLPAAAARDYYLGLSPDGKTRIPVLPRRGGSPDRAAPAIPWQAWAQPLAFWLPLMLVIAAFSTSLVRVVHRQWSQHELLSYPLAAALHSLIEIPPGRVFPAICRERVFWVGFAIPAFIYLVNGLHAHFRLMVDIPMMFSHAELIKEFDFLGKYCGAEAYALFRGYVYLFVIAIAVLLPAELSLTSWLGWVLMVFGTGAYFQLTGERITGGDTMSLQYGMYMAMGAAILFVGRREYGSVLRCALTFRRADTPAMAGAVRACRVFLMSAAALWALFVIAGLGPGTALLLVAAFGLVVLLIARMTAETGIPWLPNFSGMASALPLKLLGAAAIGPKAVAVLAVLGMALDYNMANSIAAQATTIDKLREVHPRPTGASAYGGILALGVVVAVVAGVFCTLRDNYSFGARQEGMAAQWEARLTDAGTEIVRLRLEAGGGPTDESSPSGPLRLCRLDPAVWRFVFIGAALVAGCAAMRTRFVWWPFHPLPLLFVNTWAMSRLYFSFLIGWALKTAILRIWGGKAFTQLKPLFVGVIVGQVAIYGVWLAANTLVALATGSAPVLIEGFYYGH
jgi:hypothetical protein